MNSLNLEESFEYRHKKFDQISKRADFLGCSAGDYECIKVEIERISENLPKVASKSKSHNFNWSTIKTNLMGNVSSDTSESNCSDSLALSEVERPRSSSCGSYTSSFSVLPNIRHTSTPFMAITAPAIPPPTAVLPKISDETLRSICKYHGNMVRKFPKKERTPKDQERRNKNTLACRMSRRVKKLEHIAIEEQYKEFSQQTFKIIEQSLRATAYLHELMKLSSCKQMEEIESKLLLTEQATASSSNQAKKPFTIAYLTGQEE